MIKMYPTLLILKFSKCNMFKYVYKIINTFFLYHWCLFYIKFYYIAVLCVSNISFLEELIKN